ncbi:GH92 family glycosyl hydrolase [Flavobacteriaceae bacterium]|nr:GH92 family glycosyl hydrolase [Flavobacteriaceae bacterium]
MKYKKTVFYILFLFFSTTFSQQLSEIVDTRIGTKGESLACGYSFIGATYPFGMVQFTPSFFSPQKGFVVTQLSGAGCSNMGNFPVVPMAGNLKDSPFDMNSLDPFESVNNASAGYLSVNSKNDITSRLTVTKRSAIAQFKFKNSKKGTIIIGSGVNSSDAKHIKNSEINITSSTTCEGFTEGGDFCGTETPYKVYFAAEFDRPANELGTWSGNELTQSLINKGKNSGAFFTFSTENNNEVYYRIAISFVSIENAKENLMSEKLNTSFDGYLTNTQNVWNKHLSKIKITTTNDDKKIQFYTNFYHSLIHPNIVSDINGDYMGADFKVYNNSNGKEHYSSFSVWDTYRTQAQLLAMLFPKESSEMMQSLVNFAEQAGGYGRWILANIETGIMQGDPTPILISNSFAFGAKDFDHKKAYKYMYNGAMVPRLNSQKQEIRPYLTEYINNGHTFASMMLEYTSSDFAIGQFALQALNKKNDAKLFIDRSQNWNNIYNPKIKWLNSKYPNNVWKDITHDWREGTYKNYFWMVPYNLKGLINKIGGNEFAEKRLDTLFTRLDAKYEDDWFAAGNEPDFQVPWTYNWINKPNKTSQTISRILNEQYNSSVSGLPGNDDLGTMGAWYVFASIGLYPMIPGVGGFSINIPAFENISINLPNNKILKINKTGPDNFFIKSLSFNDTSHNSTWINWNKISKGGVLSFEIANNNQSNWGINETPPSFK